MIAVYPPRERLPAGKRVAPSEVDEAGLGAGVELRVEEPDEDHAEGDRRPAPEQAFQMQRISAL
jgi:hypothetical protein